MRKSCRFLGAWLMAMFCLSIAVHAQTSTIKGTVRNSSTKEVVPAVSVVVKGTSQGTFTNSNGEFTLNVPKLPVTLVFSSVNYDTYEVAVSDAAASIEVDFKPNMTLGQEVVVAASRVPQRILEAPVTIERMSSGVLRNIPAPSYYEAITNLKGVDMHTASLTFRTVTTRGFVSSGNTKLNQLIDGMDNQAPGLNFSVGSIVGLTELDVDNIELLAGASSALYGSGGINGTVLINSKNPFKYQGLSYNIRTGIMHVDGKQRKAAPYYDWSFRWGKTLDRKQRWALKLAGQLTKGSDWQADDYRNKQQVGVLSKVVGGNRSNDPNFNGVNIYGDEASANMFQFANVFRATVQANPLSQALAMAASMGATSNIVTVTNAALGNNPTPAQLTTYFGQVNAFLASAPIQAVTTAQQRADYLAAMTGFVPINLGLNNNHIPNQNASRTGYEEKYLVDYNTLNVKFTGGLHFKVTDNIEASWNTYFGTGTTVYTGADRYSLRNLKIAQHKLELKARTWFIRGYTTQENAGESYNATAAAVYVNSAWKANSTWFTQYVATFAEGRRLNGSAVPDITLHNAARAAADVGRLMPGTAAYDAALKAGRSTPIKNGGGLFLDKSDLWASEGQLNVSDVLDFSDVVEATVGVQWKQWVMNSQGTLFADTAGNIKVNETGGYLQLRKRLFEDFLTLTGALRYDKQTNYDGRWTPRLTAVLKVAKDNHVRLSFQTAYRFPTNQDQYINLVTGAGVLIGHLPEFQTLYGLNSDANPAYTDVSIIEARNTNDVTKLKKAVYEDVVPESVSSYEVGYRGIIAKKLLIDAYGYFSRYQNFILTIGVGQSNLPVASPAHLLSPFTTRNVSYKQNSADIVKATGWGLGLEYQVYKNYLLYGNVYSDELTDVAQEFVTFFNAPKYRVNIGLRNDNVYKNIGFNIVAKWQDDNYYEGTFVSGTLPSFTWVDAQVSYRPAGTKSVFRIGGTNLGNNYYRTGYGSPYVGGLYYISYGYNLF
ncbi:MAG TPA: TonB-dependent receptor [Chitinophagaceae bacterium]